MKRLQSSAFRRPLVATAAACVAVAAFAAGPARAAQTFVLTPHAVPDSPGVAAPVSRPFKDRMFSVSGAASTQDLTVGPDHDIWVVDACDPNVIQMTPRGAVTLHPYTSPNQGCTQPWSITTGPDGAMWFVDQMLDAVFRLTVEGKVTEYPLPSSGPSCNEYPSSPEGIVAGPDGALWLTLTQPGGCGSTVQYSPAIGRMTVDGRLTMYYLDTYGAPNPTGPTGRLTVGSDGAIWFPAHNAKDQLIIGHVTMSSGSIGYSAAIGTPQQQEFPTVGPDKDVWLTDAPDNEIMRVSPGLAVTAYILPLLPTGNYAQPGGITTGPNGELWFTTAGMSYLGQITKTGAVDYIPLGAGFGMSSGYADIALDQATTQLWFTLPGTPYVAYLKSVP